MRKIKRTQYKDKAFHLPDNEREAVARGLFHLVADTFAMAIKGYHFHWNVVSPIFEDLHEMFQEDYEQILGHADLQAERIRALGFSVPGSLSSFSSESSIMDQNGLPDWRFMVEEWIRDHVHMAREARQVQSVAEAAGDQNTLAMLDSVILFHDKRAWMFRSVVQMSPDRFPR
ncbi:MAG: DNA starvation/stationary phase protection protein [Candidatus Altiarchaeales archaeon]|nr:DNA starvation/stationary phase protection protein [Candidatus Altiarchaeales archaeon]